MLPPGSGINSSGWVFSKRQRQMTEDDLVIKRHMRAAAGIDISKPELLRTPYWLARTVDHIVSHCIDKGPQGGGDPKAAWEDVRIQTFMALKRDPREVVEDDTASDVSVLGCVFFKRKVSASAHSESYWRDFASSCTVTLHGLHGLPPLISARALVALQLYTFVWDRLRMVRSDYNMQGYNAVVGIVSEACIVAHERMAR